MAPFVDLYGKYLQLSETKLNHISYMSAILKNTEVKINFFETRFQKPFAQNS